MGPRTVVHVQGIVDAWADSYLKLKVTWVIPR